MRFQKDEQPFSEPCGRKRPVSHAGRIGRNTATTVTVEPKPTPEPEPTAEPEPEAKEESGGMGGILLIMLALAAGSGAFYYFKILKPKQSVQGGTDLSELDELDFDDEDDFMSAGAGKPVQEDEDE